MTHKERKGDKKHGFLYGGGRPGRRAVHRRFPLLTHHASVRGLGAFHETLRRAATHLVLLWLGALPTLVRFPQQVDANLYVKLICLSL